MTTVARGRLGRLPVSAELTIDGASAVAARGLVKEYRRGEVVERVLAGVDLDVRRGSFVSVMGPSGSGKSTLLHLLGGLDRPDAGEVLLDGSPLSSLSDEDRTLLRRGRIGIVYQFFNLVPVLSVDENIALPAVIAGRRERAYRGKLDEIVELVGLADHRTKRPDELSGGQQQRAAIGRALFVEPAVLLADEPTGNLDFRSGADILALFVEAQRSLGQTIVMVTHDPRSAAHGEEVLLLRGGSMAGPLVLSTRCRDAARIDRSHEARSRAVLRWLEQQEQLDDAVVPRDLGTRAQGPATLKV
jgi:putative ABC transport system ATP-binding protein